MGFGNTRGSKSTAGRYPGPTPLAREFDDGYLFKEKSYAEIVHRLLRSLKVRYEAGEASEELEKKLMLKVLQTAWKKTTSEQRTQWAAQLARLARKANPAWVRSAVAGSGLFGALTAAQASGFNIYLAATTALATVTQGWELRYHLWPILVSPERLP